MVDAYLKVADQHNQAGKLDKYIEFLALAVGENPQTTSLHLKLGDAYEEAQEYAKAVAQWQMVLDLDADHPQRMRLLNLIEKHRGKKWPAWAGWRCQVRGHVGKRPFSAVPLLPISHPKDYTA